MKIIRRAVVSLYLPALYIILVTSVQAQKGKEVTAHINKASGLLEIRNGMLGIVLPSEKTIAARKYNLAPIQSFIYSDGTYSDNTLNFLKAASPPLSMKLTLLKNEPQEVKAKIEYRFNKKAFVYGGNPYRGGEEGPGFYTCMITVRLGEASIVIEEESDYDFEYRVNITEGLNPDKARYRGWQSSSTEYGYEPDGSVYRQERTRGYPLDATINLDYKKEIVFPRLSLWNPAGGEVNSGRYWQLYNSSAGENSNLIGFYHGKPSRLIGAQFTGPALKISPAEENSKRPNAEIYINFQRRGPDDSWWPRKRYQWAIFISTRKDLLAADKTQPIALELNRVAGIGSQVKKYATKPGKLVSSFYHCSLYLSPEKITELYTNLKKDKSFYNTLCALQSGYKPVWDAWRFPDSAKSLIKQLLDVKKDLEKQFVDGEGVYQSNYRYWIGVLNYKYYAICASALFADKSIMLSDNNKKNLEQLVMLMGRILWDDNNVPLFDSAGVNMGPANMAFQYRNNGRFFFALLLANDPEFAQRAKNIPKLVSKDLEDAIYSNGASIGSPHYTQASIEPILFTLLQLKQAGLTDFFKTEPKIKAFARFYSALLTPPSCRFENNRKLISFGDGSEESAAIFGLLATGYKKIDDAFSEQLISIYYNGPARFSFAGPIPLAIELTNKASQPLEITSSCYTGYLSHFRSDINTSNESAVWVLNGDKLYDHRNDDAGELAIYALGAPLSLSRSSFYYPSATDARIRSVVVPEKLFPEWNGAAQPIAGRSLSNRTWPESSSKEFANLGYAAVAIVQMKNKEGGIWTRTVSSVNLHPGMPVYIIYDSVSGNEFNIWSMQMMSEGPVKTPGGPVTPVKRMYNNNDKKELPSATPVKQIEGGWKRFGFNGQPWKLHPSGGIDWYLYTYVSKPVNVTLSHWGTNWQNAEEQAEFRKSNGRDYTEEQQIIRMQSKEPFLSIILPYLKGTNPYSQGIRELTGKQLLLQQQEDELRVGARGMVVQTTKGGIIALLKPGEKIQEDGFSIEGGIAGLEYNDKTIWIRVHGNSGQRVITVPYKKIKPLETYTGIGLKATANGTIITIQYKNNSSDLPVGEKGYTEYKFTNDY